MTRKNLPPRRAYGRGNSEKDLPFLQRKYHVRIRENRDYLSLMERMLESGVKLGSPQLEIVDLAFHNSCGCDLDNPKVRELLSEYRSLVLRFEEDIFIERNPVGNIPRPKGYDAGGGKEEDSPNLVRLEDSLRKELSRSGFLGIGL
jgi:hypothetical protein